MGGGEIWTCVASADLEVIKTPLLRENNNNLWYYKCVTVSPIACEHILHGKQRKPKDNSKVTGGAIGAAEKESLQQSLKDFHFCFAGWREIPLAENDVLESDFQ